MTKSKKLKAAIVYSGIGIYSDAENSSANIVDADDQDTLIQLQEISDILSELGYEVIHVACNSSIADLENALKNIQPDFIFNLVETLNGSDQLIYLAAGFYELMKIPYSGCSALSLAHLASKVAQKQMLLLAGLPTAEYFLDSPIKEQNLSQWIVKSDSEHASVGINSDSVVSTVSEALKTIQQKTNQFSGVWFAERYIDGREFNLSILQDKQGQPQVLPAAEIVFKNFPKHLPKIVDYAAKWDSESEVYAATQRSFDFEKKDQILITKLNDICIRVWRLFNLKGGVRVDFRIDQQGNPWILEVNPNPCLSSDAGFMAAALQAGISGKEVIRRLLPDLTALPLPE